MAYIMFMNRTSRRMRTCSFTDFKINHFNKGSAHLLLSELSAYTASDYAL